MIGALAVHLTQNGYNQPGDIVILTPYLGQLNKIFNHLYSRFQAQVKERSKGRLYTLVPQQDEETKQEVRSQKCAEKSDVVLTHIRFTTIDNFQVMNDSRYLTFYSFCPGYNINFQNSSFGHV
jgi:hypothetical protein